MEISTEAPDSETSILSTSQAIKEYKSISRRLGSKKVADSQSNQANTPRVASPPQTPTNTTQEANTQPRDTNTQNEGTNRSTTQSTSDLVLKLNRKIHGILTEQAHQISDDVKRALNISYQDLKKLQTNVKNDQEKVRDLENIIATQQQQQTELRQYIQMLSEKIPSVTDVKDAVHSVLHTHTQALQEATELTNTILQKFKNLPQTQQIDTLITSLEINSKHMEDLNNRPQEMANEQEQQQQQTTHQGGKMQENTERPIKPYKKTLIIRAMAKNSTGREIKKSIDDQKLMTDARITKITVNRSNIEIICASERDKEILRKDLTNNIILSTTLAITDKPKLLTKAIITNARKETTFEEVQTIMDSIYITDTDDIQFLREQPSRYTDHKNIIVLLAPALLRALITDNGVQLGFKRLKFQPYTTVLRCRRCQLLHHHEKSCTNNNTCENCSTQHEDCTQCTRRQHCINCATHNTKNNTKFDTIHKTSDPKCNVYRLAYSRERERLDKLYNNNTRENQKQKPTAASNKARELATNSSSLPSTSTANNPLNGMPSRAQETNQRQRSPSRFTTLPVASGTSTSRNSNWNAGPPSWMQTSKQQTTINDSLPQHPQSDPRMFTLFQQFLQYAGYPTNIGNQIGLPLPN